MSEVIDITVSTHQQARAALRNRDLRQALYDEGDVVMADVLVNLHGADHRARRRLENRLFTRSTHRRYERELFPRSWMPRWPRTSQQDMRSWSRSATR